MAIEISWFGALVAGALSFFSPCVLPLVPPYLCYMAGISIDEFRLKSQKKQAQHPRRKLVFASVLFVLGFTVVFVALGAGATIIGSYLLHWQQYIARIAGCIVILMGLNFLGILRLSLLSREARFQLRNIQAGPVSAFVMGLAFAFGWTPCIGPILGPILTLAGSRETIHEGASLLAVYSLGLGVPFILSAMFSGMFMHLSSGIRAHLGKVEKMIGLLLVITGILFACGQMQNLSYRLLEAFPFLEKIG